MPKQTLKEQIIKILGSITPSDYYETSFLGLNEAGDETFSDYADQILSLLKEEKKKWKKENNINTGGHIWAMPTCSRCKREVPFTTDESMIFYEGESLCGECYEKLKKLKE